MRRFWWLGVVLVVAAWWSWPYAGAVALGNAAAAHDANGVMARIDAPALKRSLARQIVAAYLRKSGRAARMGAYERGLANALGTSIATPYLDQLLTPEAITSLLGQGSLPDLRVGDRTVTMARDLPSLTALFRSNLTYVVLHSSFTGIATFRFAVPASGGNDADTGIELRLSGLTWRLAGLDLPADLLDRIAADAIAAEKAKGG